ncbi:MAG: FAD-binding protein [Magnetococcales bacterium]|nr:FAD-binding protein [Magnetococcales bacterium]
MRHLPQAVALPSTRAQVADVVRLCHQASIPVVPRGAGTGCVGGSLAVQGGIILSLQRLNRMLTIAPADRLAVVEPGVVNADLQARLAQHGLFWPPDPSSARSCTIGGNLAMCSAGPNALRYGATRQWVLGLTVILADGSTMRVGGKTTKGVVGYDLTQLLIGSEGTLAIVVEATLKLAPLAQARRTLRASYRTMEQAALAVAEVMSQGDPPLALEFLDPAAVTLVRSQHPDICHPDGQALLLAEVEGSADEIEHQAKNLAERLSRLDPVEVVIATSAEASKKIWAARYALSPTLTRMAPKRINEDVVVPVSALATLITGVTAISQETGVQIVSFGHAGNGNIHVNLLTDPTNPAQKPKITRALEQLFALVLELGGTLSGEHGVGITKRDFIHWELDPCALTIQRQIKQIFDPKGILNPGKIFARDETLETNVPHFP